MTTTTLPGAVPATAGDPAVHGGLMSPFSVDKIIVPTKLCTLDAQPTGRCNLARCENNGVSPRALAAIRNPTADMLVNHWEPQDELLRRLVGASHGVRPGQVFLTSGAMGGIRYAFEVFGIKARHIGLLQPEWPGLRYFADRTGAERSILAHREFPFHFEIEDVVRFVRARAVDFMIISNPSACTGQFWERGQVETLLESCPRTMFVLDEADSIYPERSGAPLVDRHRNVVFLESFSKFYGLSGLRIGYPVTRAEYCEAFDNTIDILELTSLAIVAAREAFVDVEYQRATQRGTEENLATLTAALAGGPYRIAPGSECFAAYLYADEPTPDPYVTLAERGVDLVPGAWFGLDRGGRLNLRDPGEVGTMIAALEGIRVRHDLD
jgi:histidinol-phosphate aminotransferase